jgi:DNA sulfur modification protein DndD
VIIDTIIIENYGAYSGRQVANVTPQDGKPIILFGGLNGGGKTTLLDAIQLAFYGPKAKISNRGRQSYKDYLSHSIHRGADPSEGASVTIRFHRIIDGEIRNFDLCRSWRQGVKGIEETVRVLRDGLHDQVFTDHWDEVIEAHLPSTIAHLFFFDGEQIMELAEGGHAAEILGVAVNSLLGLDLVDRLETDLKVFERRKRAEGIDDVISGQISVMQEDLLRLDQEQERLALQEGTLINLAGRIGKDLIEKEALFESEGGGLYKRQSTLESELTDLKNRRSKLHQELRELVAGPLPLILLDSLLAETEAQVSHEQKVRHARTLVSALEERDNEFLQIIKRNEQLANQVRFIDKILAEDRDKRRGLAGEPELLAASDSLATHISHLRAFILPNAKDQWQVFIDKICSLDENIARIESDLERVPAAERIAIIQNEVNIARQTHAEKISELELIRSKREILRKQRSDAETRIERLIDQNVNTRVEEDDRQRMLKHSKKVRETLEEFRTQVVQQHIASMESLMFESFQKLLRKTGLVTALRINPKNFEAILIGRDSKPLAFERLSAGERQLLATSMLWGLARASGRPIPTIIDTPLGRLDSKHRSNLTKRYFPNASHQVILLSTDEELVGNYLADLKPYITRTFLLSYDEQSGATQIQEGYFS